MAGDPRLLLEPLPDVVGDGLPPGPVVSQLVDQVEDLVPMRPSPFRALATAGVEQPPVQAVQVHRRELLEGLPADVRQHVEPGVPLVRPVGALLERRRPLRRQPLVLEELAHRQPPRLDPGPVVDRGQRLDARRLGLLAGAEPTLAHLAPAAVAVGHVDVVGPVQVNPRFADVAATGHQRPPRMCSVTARHHCSFLWRRWAASSSATCSSTNWPGR